MNFDCCTAERRPRTHLSFDPKERFPSKLYDVANDGYLVKWNSEGMSVLIEEDFFQERVMDCYPGFVQIATFLNLRRLFREYSFDWRFVEGTDNLFEFSHPAFIRDRKDLLCEITTKRKSIRRFSNRKSHYSRFTLSPQRKRRYRRRKKVFKTDISVSDISSENSTSSVWTESSLTLSATRSNSDLSQAPCSEFGSNIDSCSFYSPSHVACALDGPVRRYCSTKNTAEKSTQQDLMDLLDVFAKNELTHDEYLQLVANKAADEEQPCFYSRSADDTRESTSQHVPESPSQELPIISLSDDKRRCGRYKSSRAFCVIDGDSYNQQNETETAEAEIFRFRNSDNDSCCFNLDCPEELTSCQDTRLFYLTREKNRSMVNMPRSSLIENEAATVKEINRGACTQDEYFCVDFDSYLDQGEQKTKEVNHVFQFMTPFLDVELGNNTIVYEAGIGDKSSDLPNSSMERLVQHESLVYSDLIALDMAT